jgi:hypothetical protein
MRDRPMRLTASRRISRVVASATPVATTNQSIVFPTMPPYYPVCGYRIYQSGKFRIRK